MKYIYERVLLNQLAILEGLVVALPLGNRRGIQDSIVQTEMTLRRMEQERMAVHLLDSKVQALVEID